MGKIDDRKKRELINSYAFRLKAMGVKFNYKKFKEVFNNIPNNEISDKLSSLMNNKNFTIDYLNKLGINTSNKVNGNDLTEKVKKQLNLSDITEFSNNGKGYFKFKSSDGQIYIVRNLGDDSKELFTNILNNSNINFSDGKKNASEIFKRLNEKKFIEVQTSKADEIKDKEKNASESAIIKKLEEKFPNKEIIASLEEDIYIVKGNTTEEDILLSTNFENGKYIVKPIKQKTYGAKIENNDKKEETNNTEIPNDVLEEIENDIDVQKIIDEGLNNNLDDEIIEKVAENKLRENNPKFTNINIRVAISIMIARARQARQENSQRTQNMGGRQYVLRNNNTNMYNENNI